MKLLQPKKSPQAKDESPRGRLIEDVKTELFRLTLLVDELKARGSLDDLEAAQKMIWGLTLMLDQRKHKE